MSFVCTTIFDCGMSKDVICGYLFADVVSFLVLVCVVVCWMSLCCCKGLMAVTKVMIAIG